MQAYTVRNITKTLNVTVFAASKTDACAVVWDVLKIGKGSKLIANRVK